MPVSGWLLHREAARTSAKYLRPLRARLRSGRLPPGAMGGRAAAGIISTGLVVVRQQEWNVDHRSYFHRVAIQQCGTVNPLLDGFLGSRNEQRVATNQGGDADMAVLRNSDAEPHHALNAGLH